jgi:tetratricopeptide (TPR) repeat protein
LNSSQVLPGLSVAIQPNISMRTLAEQDYDLLFGMAARGYELNGRGLCSLAKVLAMLGDAEQAVEGFKGCGDEISEDPEMAAWAYYEAAKLMVTDAELKQKIDAYLMVEEVEAAAHAAPDENSDPREDLLNQAMEKYSGMPELLVLAALHASNTKQYKKAVRFAKGAVQLGCFAPGAACKLSDRRRRVDVASYYEAPFAVLKDAYQQLGKDKKATAAREAYSEAQELRVTSELQPRMGLYHVQNQTKVRDAAAVASICRNNLHTNDHKMETFVKR